MTATWTATLVAVTPQAEAAPLFTELEDLRYATLTVVDELDGDGSCELEMSLRGLSDSSKSRLLNVFGGPCELWVWRDAVKVFAGKVHQPRISGAGALTLSASGLLFYLKYMARDTNYVVRARDQSTIVKELVDAYQNDTTLGYGHFGLDTATLTETAVARDLTYLAVEARRFDAVFSEIGAQASGFDLWADPSSRCLYTITPWRGSDLSASIIIDSRQITDASWGASVGPGQVATDVIATTSTPTGSTFISRAGNAELRAAAGRITAVVGLYGITNRATLDAHALQLVADLGVQVEVIGSQLIPVDLEYGQVAAGDSVTFDYDFGLGPASSTRRLRRVAASVESAGERISVDFV